MITSPSLCYEDMAPENVTSLFLSQPLPTSAISLGRLIRDPLFPDVGYYEPKLGTNHPISEALSQQQEQHVTANVAEYRFENFEDTLDSARGKGLELKLLQLSASSKSQNSSSTTLRSRLCVIRQLRDPVTYFRSVCCEAGARAWLEEESLRPSYEHGRRGGQVYLVCGFKTLTDASVSHSSKKSRSTDVSADGVVASIATAAAGVPLPVPGDLGAAVRRGNGSGETLAYTAPGERVFAVQYRRIRFAWFSSRSVDSAYLEKDNRWKSMIASRSEEGEEEDGIEVDLVGSLGKDELEESFEVVEINGEQMLYAIDDEQQQEEEEE
ncbi:hypothetical protein EDB81DRAFT_736394, partial [Dactylonectria macrodidyma]